MSDIREWMDLLVESEADSNIEDHELIDIEGYDNFDDWEMDQDLKRFNLPIDPELYQKYSKDFIYHLVRYMRTNWLDMSDFLRFLITSAFDREMPVLKNNHTVYRGMKLDSLEELDKESNFLNYEVVEWNRLMSASFDPGIAEEFASDRDYDVGIFFTIHTMAGAKGIVTDDPELDVFLRPAVWADMEHQSEIILGRGSKFKILAKQSKEISTRRTRWEVEMQQVK